MNTKKTLYVIVVVAVILIGAAFYGGMLYGKGSGQPSGTGQYNFQQNGSSTRRGGGSFGQNSGFTGGQIISVGSNSITVQLRDGSSKIVFVSTSTSIQKSAQGAISDLTVGQNVTVSGIANSDGSITAQLVQVRPATSAGTGSGTSQPQTSQ